MTAPTVSADRLAEIKARAEGRAVNREEDACAGRTTREEALVREFLDSLRITATLIGHRIMSTPDEVELAQFLFKVSHEWDEWKAGEDR